MSNIIETIKQLENKFVTIGIHGEKGEQKKLVRLHPHNAKLSRGTKREGIDPNLTVAEVAYDNEFGNKKKGIPARPFLRGTLALRRKEIINLASKLIIKAPDKYYDEIGKYILNEIKKRISQGIAPSNSPKTIAFKGSSTPLVDTGQLRTSLTFKVGQYD